MSQVVPYTVPPEPDHWRSVLLSLLVHLALLAFLWIGVSWQSLTPATVEAEIWDVSPRDAAPPRPEPLPEPEPPKPEPPKPEPPKPAPEPAPKPKPPAPVVTPKPPKARTADPDIALEREKKRKQEKEKAAEEKQKREEQEKKQLAEDQKRQQEEQALREKKKLEEEQKRKQEQEKLAEEKQKREEQEKKQLAEDQKRQQEEQALREKKKLEEEQKRKQEAALAEEQKRKQEQAAEKPKKMRRGDDLDRILSHAGDGEAGTAEKKSGVPGSACQLYIGEKVKSNISFPDMPGSPVVRVLIRLSATRMLEDVKVIISSQYPAFDKQVERGLRKSAQFPADCPEQFEYDHYLKPR